MVADLQIEAEEANGGVLLTVVDSARLTMLLTRETAAELLDAIDACMKTGERQTTRAVDVWRAAPDLLVFGVHVSIDGASWTCGAVGWVQPTLCWAELSDLVPAYLFTVQIRCML